jgi:pyruvate/2-oxoglutarate dehydrogenase complex dihydrolipoamide acyltransferase (E2) component
MATELGVDLAEVTGTGRGERVTKKDLLAHVAPTPALQESAASPLLRGVLPSAPHPAERTRPRSAPSSGPSPAGYLAPEPTQLSPMRSVIGRHMKLSQEQAATVTTWMEVDMTYVEQARRHAGLTALPFIAVAVTNALQMFPALNAWLDGDRYTLHADINLGIAVSLGEGGLIVPVIHRAQDLSTEGFAARVGDLASRARAEQLLPGDVQGGTFTVSNAGQFGALMATPIIHQPQVAILGVEAIAKRPVVVAGPDGTDAIAIRVMTVLALSWDHRALDGELAVRFLASIRQSLERDTDAELIAAGHDSGDRA